MYRVYVSLPLQCETVVGSKHCAREDAYMWCMRQLLPSVGCICMSSFGFCLVLYWILFTSFFKFFFLSNPFTCDISAFNLNVSEVIVISSSWMVNIYSIYFVKFCTALKFVFNFTWYSLLCLSLSDMVTVNITG